MKRVVALCLILLIVLAAPASAAQATRTPCEIDPVPVSIYDKLGMGHGPLDIVDGEEYVDIPAIPGKISRAVSPLTGNKGVMNAVFAAGSNTAISELAQFNFQDNSIPETARVTSVTLTSTRTAVTGVSYFICIGRATPTGTDWAPDLNWASTVSTNWYNNEDPWGIWGFFFYATRTTNLGNIGAATLRSATLRVYYVNQ